MYPFPRNSQDYPWRKNIRIGEIIFSVLGTEIPVAHCWSIETFTFTWQHHLTVAIDIIHYHVIWTDNRGTVPEANNWRQEGKYPMIKVLRGCIFKLSLYLVNSVLTLHRTGNMQSVILSSFVASSSLPLSGFQSIHPPMPCHISPYVVYNVYDCGPTW